MVLLKHILKMTVGEAFGGFLDNPKWESGLSDDNVRFSNVTGKILYYDEEVEIVVQFIVDEETEFFSDFFIILTIRFAIEMCIPARMSFRSNCRAIREMISD